MAVNVLCGKLTRLCLVLSSAEGRVRSTPGNSFNPSSAAFASAVFTLPVKQTEHDRGVSEGPQKDENHKAEQATLSKTMISRGNLTSLAAYSITASSI